MSRPWKSVPRSVAVRPPSIQNGGSKMPEPVTGTVGSYGAMRSAESATRIRPPRRTTASRGASPNARSTRAVRLCARTVPTAIVAIVLPRQPDARVDDGVEHVDDQVDADDHEPGHDHDPLHERKIALEDSLEEQAADARPRED